MMIYIVFVNGKPGEMMLDRDAALKAAEDAREEDESRHVVAMALDPRILSERTGDPGAKPHHKGKK